MDYISFSWLSPCSPYLEKTSLWKPTWFYWWFTQCRKLHASVEHFRPIGNIFEEKMLQVILSVTQEIVREGVWYLEVLTSNAKPSWTFKVYSCSRSQLPPCRLGRPTVAAAAARALDLCAWSVSPGIASQGPNRGMYLGRRQQLGHFYSSSPLKKLT